MSEQRFTYGNPIGFGKGEIIDNQNNIHYEATINVLLQLLNDFDDVLNEQQATIRRLQDLCGESDYENAKLRLKSKELQEEIKLLKPTNIEQYEQIQKLQEENEKLKNRLNNGL